MINYPDIIFTNHKINSKQISLDVDESIECL